MRKISHGFRGPEGLPLLVEVAALVLILLEVVCIPLGEGMPEPPMVVLDPVLAAGLVPLGVMLNPVLAGELDPLGVTLDPVLAAGLDPLGVTLDPVLLGE